MVSHCKSMLKNASSSLRLCVPWLSTLVILIGWFLATLGPKETRHIPSPAEVINAFQELNSEGLIWPSLGISFTRVIAGLCLGMIIAVPAGVISGSTKLGDIIINKPGHMLRSVPFTALAPLLIILLGIGETMKIALIAIGVFGTFYVNMRDGVRNIDPRLLELARAYKVNSKTVFFTILLRGALPNFMTALRFAISVSWVALVTCETVNASKGIGYVLARSQEFYRPDQMLLCIVLYAIAGLLSEGIATLLEKICMPERRSSIIKIKQN
ncbi:binding-protein-dependent transport system, inner membrane component [Gardnerella pickettii 00703C2mash]|nr:binding-protein-dependent transport system, inner membrane component [Gardnerella pickettii 00703C2mash]